MWRAWLGFGLLLWCFSPIRAQEMPEPVRDYWPTTDWRTALPAEQGMDAEALAGIPQFLADHEMKATNSVIVVRGGYIVYENYFNGYQPTETDNTRSITKSVTSALVGIALERGDLPSVDLKVAEVFPEYFENGANADKKELSLRHLLGMRSGLQWDDGDALSLLGARQMKRIINFPLAHVPGENWNYSTADSHLVSGLFQRTTGRSLEDYANEFLFEPLGMTPGEWQTDGDGYNTGGMGLALAPLDMAKFGFLYLNNGVWDGEQIVPAAWVDWTTKAQDEAVNWYGYYWWQASDGEDKPYPAFVASGYAGDNIFVYPELDLIVVTKTRWRVNGSVANEQNQALLRLIYDLIIPAVTDAAE